MNDLIIAQAAPENMKTWLEAFFWLVAGVGALLGAAVAWKYLRPDSSSIAISPSPLEVKAHAAYALQRDHEALAKKMDEELGRERGARKLIHQEIAALQVQTSAIKTETDAQTGTLAELRADVRDMNERIDAVPERTIKLLTETKNLHR